MKTKATPTTAGGTIVFNRSSQVVFGGSAVKSPENSGTSGATLSLPGERRSRGTSIGRRSFDSIDHDHLDRRSSWFELQPELLLNRSKQGRAVWISRRHYRRSVWWRRASQSHALRSPREVKAVVPREPGAVDHEPLRERREQRREL